MNCYTLDHVSILHQLLCSEVGEDSHIVEMTKILPSPCGRVVLRVEFDIPRDACYKKQIKMKVLFWTFSTLMTP